MLRLIPVCPECYSFPFPHTSSPAGIILGEISCVRTGGNERATGEICKTIEHVKIVSVYLIFQNYQIKVIVSLKCYDSFENVTIRYLQCTA